MIETNRLILRPFTLDDTQCLAKICNEITLYKGVLFIPFPYSEKDATNFITYLLSNDCKESAYAIVLKDSNRLIGNVSVGNKDNHNSGEVGYYLDIAYRNKGYMSEAAKALIDYAFNELDYHRLYSKHFLSNPASGEVMKKIGMQYEGTFIDEILKDGKYESCLHYAIINPKYKKEGD